MYRKWSQSFLAKLIELYRFSNITDAKGSLWNTFRCYSVYTYF